MASKIPAVKGAAYTFRAVLFAQTGNQIKTTPTISAGDFQTSKDGGAFGNLATLPAESPASSGQVLITLSTTEMNGDEIMVRAIDASGDEWHSQAWTIHTTAQTFDTTDGVADAIKAKTDNLPADPADDSDIDSQLAAIAAYVDTEVAAILAAVDTEVAAIKAKTDNLPSDPADQSAVEAAITTATSGLATSAALATVDGNVDAILADTNELQTNQGNWLTADVSGLATAAAVGALNDLSAAEVNAEMDTAISDAGLATAADLAAVDGIVDDILADTDELQANQGAWATADVSGLATSAEVGALNNLSAQQVWEYVTRELTSAGANGATAQEVWEYATRELTGTAGATPQQVWEYATRELTAGTRDNEIDAIADDLHDIVTSGVTSILVASPVRGRAATVYQYATWDTEFALSEAPDLTGFENVIFAVKDNENQADTDAILYVDTATGLKYIGGAAASSANAGSLVISSATKFVVCVGKDEVAAKLASRFNGGFTWFLKGIETSSLPNKAVFIASGIWSIEKGGIRAVG